MAYHDQECACGCKKPRDTMLCHGCKREFEGSVEMRTLHDPEASIPFKRAAAIQLLRQSRERKARMRRAFVFNR